MYQPTEGVRGTLLRRFACIVSSSYETNLNSRHRKLDDNSLSSNLPQAPA